MPNEKYYRSQAQLLAHLAATARNPAIAERYNALALEQLAKAEQAEPGARPMGRAAKRTKDLGRTNQD
jgi:hypothetical protein